MGSVLLNSKLAVTQTTHDADGLTSKDFDQAPVISKLR